MSEGLRREHAQSHMCMDEAGITVPVPLLRTRLEAAWHAGLHTLHRVCLHVGACVNEECVQCGRCEVGRSRVSRLVGRRVSAARAPSRAAVTGRAVWTRVSPSQSSGNERVQHGVQREPCFRVHSYFTLHSEPTHLPRLASHIRSGSGAADSRRATAHRRVASSVPHVCSVGTRHPPVPTLPGHALSCLSA